MAPSIIKSAENSPASCCCTPSVNKSPRPRIITPIIKIVHVHAPKLVCTDAANFRALVQEMTGNASTDIKKETSPKSSSSTSGQHLEASDETDCPNGVITSSARTSVTRRQQHRRGGCRRAKGSLHGATGTLVTTSPSAAREMEDHLISTGDGDADDEGGSTCEHPVTRASVVSSVASGYNSDSVDAFFADHDLLFDQAAISTKCTSAYLALSWRRDNYEMPGGFDYFSF